MYKCDHWKPWDNQYKNRKDLMNPGWTRTEEAFSLKILVKFSSSKKYLDMIVA